VRSTACGGRCRENWASVERGVSSHLTVRALQPGEERAWQQFLHESSNATLFHDLDFLAYHPPGRFRFHHLVACEQQRIRALLPGGLVDGPTGTVWRSPIGASIGGPVLGRRAGLDDTLAIVDALQHHARASNWMSIELTLPPVVYHPAIGDQIGFALFTRGFREQHRWFSPMIDLSLASPGSSVAEALFEKRQIHALRSALRDGAVAEEGGVECLDHFAPLFEATYARLGARPTHTVDEVRDLLQRVPDRVRLVLARSDGAISAAVLLMQLTREVASTFYICRSPEHHDSAGSIVAIAVLADTLRARGSRWLDLGPSASDETRNAGVLFFKEGLGGVGYCRSQWSWTPE